jgi:hypothetical protein
LWISSSIVVDRSLINRAPAQCSQFNISPIEQACSFRNHHHRYSPKGFALVSEPETPVLQQATRSPAPLLATKTLSIVFAVPTRKTTATVQVSSTTSLVTRSEQGLRFYVQPHHVFHRSAMVPRLCFFWLPRNRRGRTPSVTFRTINRQNGWRPFDVSKSVKPLVYSLYQKEKMSKSRLSCITSLRSLTWFFGRASPRRAQIAISLQAHVTSLGHLGSPVQNQYPQDSILAGH